MAGDAMLRRLLALRGWAVWIRTVTPAFPLSQDAINERDAKMAENLLAFVDTIPESDRVVVLLHNVHAFRELRPIFSVEDGTAVEGMTVPVAEIVCRRLGERAYCLGMAAASGSVNASWNPAPRPIELGEESFERRALKGSDADSVFVTCGPGGDAPGGVMPGGLMSFRNAEADWGAMFDGVWVLSETRGVARRGE